MTDQAASLCLLGASAMVGALHTICTMRTSFRKVGGLRFVRLGRLSLSFCVTR